MKPFRWNLAKPEQLGRLVAGWEDVTWSDAEMVQIRSVSARIIAHSTGSTIVFLGRSPELFFDYLSGHFDDSRSYQPLVLANISLRDLPSDYESFRPTQKRLFKSFLLDHCLSPELLLKTPVTLVDYVASGETFTRLFNYITALAKDQGLDVKAVQRRLKFLGLVARKKNSPNTFRWYQHIDWGKQLKREQLKSVSVEPDFMYHVANSEEKMTQSFTHWRWQRAAEISRHENNLNALKRSFSLFQLASSASERSRFQRQLRQLM